MLALYLLHVSFDQNIDEPDDEQALTAAQEVIGLSGTANKAVRIDDKTYLVSLKDFHFPYSDQTVAEVDLCVQVNLDRYSGGTMRTRASDGDLIFPRGATLVDCEQDQTGIPLP